MNTSNFVSIPAQMFADQEVLVFEDHRWTYGKLWEEIQKVAVGFRKIGIERGDRIAVLQTNSDYYIAAYFAAARHLFDSSLAGLLAAALVTFDLLAIKWGVWARGYAQAHLFLMLGLTLLLTGTLKEPRRSARLLALLCLMGALFSHTLTLFALPPLALLLVIFTAAYRPGLLRQPGLWLEAALCIDWLCTVVARRDRPGCLPAPRVYVGSSPNWRACCTAHRRANLQHCCSGGRTTRRGRYCDFLSAVE